VHNVNVTMRDGCLSTLRTSAVLNVNRGLAGAIALTKRIPTEPASFNAAVGVRRACRRAVESIVYGFPRLPAAAAPAMLRT